MDKKGFDAHHVFPKKFEGRFADLGIDIHDPKYAVWWEKHEHRRSVAAYNDEFEEFLASPAEKSKKNVLEFGRSQMRNFKIHVAF